MDQMLGSEPPALPDQYEKIGNQLAYESRINPDALRVVAREIAAKLAAKFEADRAGLTELQNELPVRIERLQAEHAAGCGRLEDDERNPSVSRETKAKQLDAEADHAQANWKGDRGLKLMFWICLACSYLYYVSASNTALFLGARLAEANSPARLLHLLTSLFDPSVILRCLSQGNFFPFLFGAVPTTASLLCHRFALRRAYLFLAACVAVIAALDLGIAYGVIKAHHEVSVAAGIEPDAPWGFPDAVVSSKFWLVIAIGFGMSIVLAAVNHFVKEADRAEATRWAGIRNLAADLRAAVEKDLENRRRIPELVRGLEADLKATIARLHTVGSVIRSELEARLTALLRGWLVFASQVHDDKATLRRIKREADQALDEARALRELPPEVAVGPAIPSGPELDAILRALMNSNPKGKPS